MQLKFQQHNELPSSILFQKRTSQLSLADTSHSSTNSSSSLDSIDDQCRKYAVRWILSYNKKLSKDTQYLALSYLNRLQRKGFFVSQQNYEKIALTLLLLACKFNEIYPPTITSLISKCRKPLSQQEIIDFQGSVLKALDFEMAGQHNAYTYMHCILGCLYADKLEQCQKLLKMVTPYRQIYRYGQQILAYAIIYLIIPDFIRKMNLRQAHCIKALAVKIYNLYAQVKVKHDSYKENRQ